MLPGNIPESNKPPLYLLPWDGLRALADVLGLGAIKHGMWNWTEGMSWMECAGSALNHLSAWIEGEDIDPDSGKPHIAMACTRLLFLVVFTIRNVGTDDRPPHKPTYSILATQPVSSEGHAVYRFALSVLHGDDQHRKWLLEEACKFVKKDEAELKEILDDGPITRGSSLCRSCQTAGCAVGEDGKLAFYCQECTEILNSFLNPLP